MWNPSELNRLAATDSQSCLCVLLCLKMDLQLSQLSLLLLFSCFYSIFSVTQQREGNVFFLHKHPLLLNFWLLNVTAVTTKGRMTYIFMFFESSQLQCWQKTLPNPKLSRVRNYYVYVLCSLLFPLCCRKLLWVLTLDSFSLHLWFFLTIFCTHNVCNFVGSGMNVVTNSLLCSVG